MHRVSTNDNIECHTKNETENNNGHLEQRVQEQRDKKRAKNNLRKERRAKEREERDKAVETRLERARKRDAFTEAVVLPVLKCLGLILFFVSVYMHYTNYGFRQGFRLLGALVIFSVVLWVGSQHLDSAPGLLGCPIGGCYSCEAISVEMIMFFIFPLLLVYTIGAFLGASLFVLFG